MNPVYFMLPVCVSASYSFMLPVATGPNALVYASGKVTMKDMVCYTSWHFIKGHDNFEFSSVVIELDWIEEYQWVDPPRLWEAVSGEGCIQMWSHFQLDSLFSPRPCTKVMGKKARWQPPIFVSCLLIGPNGLTPLFRSSSMGFLLETYGILDTLPCQCDRVCWPVWYRAWEHRVPHP